MITCHHPTNASVNLTQRRSMLVVDDEVANRALLERLFKREFEIISVQDGQQALDILSQRTFDIVLLDIMMPKINGLDVLRHIRETPEIKDLPVILVSALSDSPAVVEGLQLGANDYVSKPLEMDVLVARVQTQVMLKQLLDERKQHIHDLKVAQDFKDRFFQMASHDLKGPLGNLRMAHTLIRDDEDLKADSNAHMFLDLADDAVDTMQRVIEEFLDLAVLQNGQLKLHMTEVVVDTVIKRLTDQYRLSASKKEIEIEIGMSDTLLCADETLFTQALSNLISNAVKYSPFHTCIRVWAEQQEGIVRINVADQGPGVPDSERGMLFKQFGKLKARPTNGESSTGLGLWIVKSHIEIQHGQVGVDCPPEGGSIFWIEMPAL